MLLHQSLLYRNLTAAWRQDFSMLHIVAAPSLDALLGKCLTIYMNFLQSPCDLFCMFHAMVDTINSLWIILFLGICSSSIAYSHESCKCVMLHLINYLLIKLHAESKILRK